MDILVHEQRRDENYILLYDMVLSNPVSSSASSSSALPPHTPTFKPGAGGHSQSE